MPISWKPTVENALTAARRLMLPFRPATSKRCYCYWGILGHSREGDMALCPHAGLPQNMTFQSILSASCLQKVHSPRPPE